MSKSKIILLAIGLGVGFIVGFFVADSANRRERDALRAENARFKSGPLAAGGGVGSGAAASTTQPVARPEEDPSGIPKITEEQMRAAIRKADANPSDADIQKKTGQVLFIYATQTGNSAVMPDAARILRRAHEAEPKDYESIVLLGNALFIIARSTEGDNGDPSGRLREARVMYGKALALKTDDPLVRTSLGLTYFYDQPSDPQRAITEYRKSLVKYPRHEMTLQSLTAALIAVDNFDEAEKTLGQLAQVNAANSQLANLRAQLAQRRNAAKEKD